MWVAALVLFAVPRPALGASSGNQTFVGLDGCTFSVAHCIVGAARSFPQPEVFRSIAEHLVWPSAPLGCAKVFYVLDLSSANDSPKGGTYKYDLKTLRRGAWKALPPAGYVMDPPLPSVGPHPSFQDPWCLFQCVPQFDKGRRCLSLVRSYEMAAGSRFDWLVRSRPDLLWKVGTAAGDLRHLPRDAVYGRFPWDTVLAIPRHLAAPFLEGIMDKCLSVTDSQPACTAWSCDCWIALLAQNLGVPIKPWRFVFSIRRLEGPIADNPSSTIAAGPDSNQALFSYSMFKQWNRRLRCRILSQKSSVASVGHALVARQHVAPLPSVRDGCSTYLESSLCFERRSSVLSLDYFLSRPLHEGGLSSMHFGVWRPVGLVRGPAFNVSGVFLLSPLLTIDETMLRDAVGDQTLMMFPPLTVRRGDCLAWTACGGPLPVPFDEMPSMTDGRGGGAVMGWTGAVPISGESVQTASAVRVVATVYAPWRRYSVRAEVHDPQGPCDP